MTLGNLTFNWLRNSSRKRLIKRKIKSCTNFNKKKKGKEIFIAFDREILELSSDLVSSFYHFSTWRYWSRVLQAQWHLWEIFILILNSYKRKNEWQNGACLNYMPKMQNCKNHKYINAMRKGYYKVLIGILVQSLITKMYNQKNQNNAIFCFRNWWKVGRKL